jgi:hypothetical protein
MRTCRGRVGNDELFSGVRIMVTAGVLEGTMLVINNVQEVDDAGGRQFETVMTARMLMELIDTGRLKLTNNIRPDHAPGQRMKAKTKAKIEKWAQELLENRAVIGNLSIRLDPDQSLFEVVTGENDQQDLYLDRGDFDCAVDALSRIKAIQRASKAAAGTFDTGTRFAVRIWIATEEEAHRVAAIYNTRGDKVNDTAAKYAYQETAGQRIARTLMMGSRNLGLDNVEVLSNTVSASSPKLVAFNTLVQAIETCWEPEALNANDEKAHADYLISVWDEVVKVRPEFGRVTKSARKDMRGSTVAGTAVSIYGVVAVASAMFQRGETPSAGRFVALKTDVRAANGATVDYMSYDHDLWTKIGVLVLSEDKNGRPKKSLRMSFQTRKAMADEMLRRVGLAK